ncbi:MAG: glycosyltransferase [Pseudomonadota bacterium]
MTLPFISVIVPHFNDHERLRLSLDALLEQDYPSDRYEIIVVDNNSIKPLDDLIDVYPTVRFAVERERGCGMARNHGVDIAKGEIIAFTDSDCVADKSWLSNAYSPLLKGGGADIVGGDIKLFAKNDDDPTDVELFERVYAFRQKNYITQKNFTAGASLITRRDVYEHVGPCLNGNFPEDKEWGNRAHGMGYRLQYVPEAIIRHPARREWADLVKKWDRSIMHLYFAYIDGRFWVAKWLLMMTIIALSPFADSVRVLFSPKLDQMSHRFRVMSVLFKIRWYRVRKMAGMLVRPPAGVATAGAAAG